LILRHDAAIVGREPDLNLGRLPSAFRSSRQRGVAVPLSDLFRLALVLFGVLVGAGLFIALMMCVAACRL
jgi:hypothetical protein